MDHVNEREGATGGQGWNEDLIFNMLSDRARRMMLISLARTGPQTAAQLNSNGKLGRDIALKHLAVMRKAGLVEMTKNTQDGRRSLYSLVKTVPVKATEQGCVIDFGFCMLRLSS